MKTRRNSPTPSPSPSSSRGRNIVLVRCNANNKKNSKSHQHLIMIHHVLLLVLIFSPWLLLSSSSGSPGTLSSGSSSSGSSLSFFVVVAASASLRTSSTHLYYLNRRRCCRRCCCLRSSNSSSSSRDGRRRHGLYAFLLQPPLPRNLFAKTSQIHHNNQKAATYATRIQQKSFLSPLSLSSSSSDTSQPPCEVHQPQSQPQAPHLIFPGGGIFFYWQAGVITYLRENGYILSDPGSSGSLGNAVGSSSTDVGTPSGITLTGASAGALVATLTAADVDFYVATDLALDYAKQAGVWDRSGGLQGIWGGLIRDWLHELLPTDENILFDQQQINERLSLLVTPIPSSLVTLPQNMGKTKRIHTFHNRNDLIDANMASVHLPWFLDGKLTTRFRNQPYIDGSFFAKEHDYYFKRRQQQEQEQEPPPQKKFMLKDENTIIIDYKLDPQYQKKGLFEFVNAVSPDGIYRMLEDGKQYAKYLEEHGKLECLPRIYKR